MSGVQESPQEHIVIQNYSKNSNAMRQGPSSTDPAPFPIPTGFCPAWRQSLANAACHGVPLALPLQKKNQLSHIGVSPDPFALGQCPMEPQILPAPTLQPSREERSTPRAQIPRDIGLGTTAARGQLCGMSTALSTLQFSNTELGFGRPSFFIHMILCKIKIKMKCTT